MPWRSARGCPAAALSWTIGFGPIQRLDADPTRRVGKAGKTLGPLRLGIGMGHAPIISEAVTGLADREFGRFAARPSLEIGALPFRQRAQREQIMRHMGEAGMDDLVVHGKYEHMREIPLHQSLELGAGLAIDVAGLARR